MGPIMYRTPREGNALEAGLVFESKSDGKFEILYDRGWQKVRVRFVCSGYEQYATRSQIRKGQLKDRLKRSVIGVGYIGVGPHKSKIGKASNPIYNRWKNMLARCYSNDEQARRPTYAGCRVCDEWHNFQNYAEWFVKNCDPSMDVDKDILIEGNKLYSPQTCIGVTHQKNSERATAKNYTVTSPDGSCFEVYNLHSFCRENGLQSTLMRKVLNGSRNHHGGWKVRYAD